MIHANRGFPGWKDFGALVAHLKFVKEHHRDIEKVAVILDSGVAAIMPSIANHFVHAQVKRFDLGHEDAAWAWLAKSGDMKMRTAASRGRARFACHTNAARRTPTASAAARWMNIVVA
ncbi:MAG: STAS/SEC14 domain-containing protein [Actinomycetota bacterium]